MTLVWRVAGETRMGVIIKPNNKCCHCKHYIDSMCARGSVPRFCGERYERKDDADAAM